MALILLGWESCSLIEICPYQNTLFFLISFKHHRKGVYFIYQRQMPIFAMLQDMFQGQPLHLNNSGTFYIKLSPIVCIGILPGHNQSESEFQEMYTLPSSGRQLYTRRLVLYFFILLTDPLPLSWSSLEMEYCTVLRPEIILATATFCSTSLLWLQNFPTLTQQQHSSASAWGVAQCWSQHLFTILKNRGVFFANPTSWGHSLPALLHGYRSSLSKAL